MRKRSINITGNHQIDQAAAEIAIALRDAGRAEHEALAEAERLRDEIMAGTRALDRTIVIFRVWHGKNGGVVALFPYEPGTVGRPEMCASFEHIGQHGAAYLADVISATRAAQAEEYAALKSELEAPPFEYKLLVRQRTPEDAAGIRRAKLTRDREG